MDSRIANKIAQVEDQIAAMDAMINDQEHPGEYDFLKPEMKKAKARLKKLRAYGAPNPDIRYVVVNPMGHAVERHAKQEDMLATLQGEVGGLIEAITMEDGTVMFVDENGYARGLWPNRRATDHLHRNSPDHRAAGTQVLGTIVLMGPADNEGNSTSCTVQVNQV